MRRALPVRGSPSPRQPLVAAAAASLPWCCIVPTAIALLGAGTGLAAVSRSFSVTVALLTLSLAFLARANHLVWVHRHGRLSTRLVTIASTLLVFLSWAYRLPGIVATLGWK